jgi:hypothetical protein
MFHKDYHRLLNAIETVKIDFSSSNFFLNNIMIICSVYLQINLFIYFVVTTVIAYFHDHLINHKLNNHIHSLEMSNHAD